MKSIESSRLPTSLADLYFKEGFYEGEVSNFLDESSEIGCSEKPMQSGPSSFQKKTWWAALSALSLVTLVGVIVFVGWLILRGMSAVQFVLIPLAIAGILAYLIEPVVSFLERKKLKRIWGVLLVFTFIIVSFSLTLLWTVPSLYRQSVRFINDIPTYSRNAHSLVISTYERARALTESEPLKRFFSSDNEDDVFAAYISEIFRDGTQRLQKVLPDIAISVGNFLHRSVGGVFGFAGFLLSLILVPIFLFFFLLEGPAIAASWTNYLPLRASPFKEEVVSVLTEINVYLINFFRGQLMVSLIDGFLVAICLLVVGLDFALLIGLMVGILGLIPYAGVIISWIPAVLIATAQFGDWSHPVIVTIIFLVINNLDGIVIAPKIVGNSVGLHPLTVILSVLIWSLVLGGLLGALLAVPLTATLKVLLRRYFWESKPPSSLPSSA